MLVDAAMANGERAALQIQMTPDWRIQAAAPGGSGAAAELTLQAVLPSVAVGLIYLFAASQPGGEVDPLVWPLPTAASELLLYAPLVPLLKCSEGFQALAWSCWKEITASTCMQDFGMPPSLVPSCTALGEEEEDLDVRSLQSESWAEDSEGPESDELCNDDAELSDGASEAAGSDASL
jgi:hypothetical protein